MQYVTGHRQADKVLDLDWKRLANPDSTLVIYMGVANIGQIAMGLMTENLPGSTPVLAVGHATTPMKAAWSPVWTGLRRMRERRAGSAHAVHHRAR